MKKQMMTTGLAVLISLFPLAAWAEDNFLQYHFNEVATVAAAAVSFEAMHWNDQDGNLADGWAQTSQMLLAQNSMVSGATIDNNTGTIIITASQNLESVSGVSITLTPEYFDGQGNPQPYTTQPPYGLSSPPVATYACHLDCTAPQCSSSQLANLIQSSSVNMTPNSSAPSPNILQNVCASTGFES